MTGTQGRMIAGLDVVEMGRGKPLLMLHSLLAERTVFAHVQDDLAKSYRLIMPNLPAYGTSLPLQGEVTIYSYADKVAELADALEVPRDTDVLGNGFGGFVSVALAIKHGGRFGRFIFADTGAGFPPEGQAPLGGIADTVEAKGMDAVLDACVKRMFPQPYIDANPDVIAERRARLSEADPKMFAAAARSLAALSMHADLPKIKNDVLVMVGALDQTTPPALSHQLRDNIAGAKYLEIAGAGHCPQIQEPRQFINAVQGFLS